MIKALSAIAIAAFCRCSTNRSSRLCAAGRSQRSASPRKADRLDIHTVGPNCSQKAWPELRSLLPACRRTKTTIREARLVTADRTP